jgi:hypothetical protein
MPAPRPETPRAVEIVLVVGAYTALAVWWLWPLPRVMGTHSSYFGNEVPLIVADFYLIVWAMAWDAHALVTAPFHLFHANTFYPSTDALAYSEHFLGYVPLFAPTYWATHDPILAVNVLVLSTYPLCGLAMFLLARRFAPAPAAAVAGFFYAFYLWRYQEMVHLHMLGVQYFPLVLLATDRWLEAARARDAVLLAGALVLQSLSSFYLAYATLLVYGCGLLVGLWRWRARVDRRRLAGLALATGVLLAAMGALGWPYLRLRSVGLIPSYDDPGRPTQPGLMPTIAGLRVWEYFRAQGVGPVGYVLAALALAPPWRTARGARLLGLVVAIVGGVAAFGPGIPVGNRVLWTPYDAIVRWIPGAETIRAPRRFLLVAHTGLALLAGLGLGRLLARARPAWAWTAAVGTVALALASFAPLPVVPLRAEETGDQVPPAYRWLAQHGDERPLLEEPDPPFFESGHRMYLSTFHWLPIVDGYSGYPPASASYIHAISRGLPDEGALQSLVDVVDVGWILVHRAHLTPPAAAAWHGRLPPGLEPAGEWGEDLLLRVTRPVATDRRGRLLSTSVTLAGAPLAPLGPRCRGEIVLRGMPPQPWPLGTLMALDVSVRNDGDTPWPGFGLVPRHLVRLTACMMDAAGPPCSGAPTPLPADVPPRGELTVPVTLKSGLPGDRMLRIELLQTGDPPLAQCGVAPLTVPVRVVIPAR